MARKPKITNQQILEAARQVFFQQGFSGSTIEIAQLAGISEALIFKRFSTKEELFFAAMGLPEKALWMKELENLCGKGNLKENLIQVCFQILEFYSEVLPRFMMLRSRGNAIPENCMTKEQGPVQDVKVLTDFLEQEISLSRLRPVNAKIIAHILVGTLMNYALSEQLHFSPNHCQTEAIPDFDLKQQPKVEFSFVQGLIEAIWLGIAPI
ncbi:MULTISPECIES: TetR/AcrR family transcriptional regulator [Nostocales]|uniref:TetR/AcrR family transcriptional regulator n=1 Tax=Nostocales TaxID=1161 RepID=UPI001686BD32|nr:MULTISPECIES: TetR/AcrR family transcriptional regulator [Nostocales]MBD2300314.1 TetR/AcrR family transcriptional regulator [Nostoc sp. FACHB-190]MBD2487995.1 TetR/AcrR family transcriptional regulator [Aulosira sp. FACHB-615]